MSVQGGLALACDALALWPPGWGGWRSSSYIHGEGWRVCWKEARCMRALDVCVFVFVCVCVFVCVRVCVCLCTSQYDMCCMYACMHTMLVQQTNICTHHRLRSLQGRTSVCIKRPRDDTRPLGAEFVFEIACGLCCSVRCRLYTSKDRASAPRASAGRRPPCVGLRHPRVRVSWLLTVQ